MYVSPMTADALDFTTAPIETFQHEAKYAVDMETHHANVRAAIALGYPSLERGALTSEPVAVVCSGPSLKTTYREIKHFDKILSCSGAHEYLIDHGIVPTWHMEGDPRKHKKVFVKRPHRRVIYLLSSSCHPEVYQALKGYQIKMWHALRQGTDLLTTGLYPKDHWVLTGGTNVGQRALVMARILGHTNVHVFGMDSSAGPETFHTGYHPNDVPKEVWQPVRVRDQVYYSTPLFILYAKHFFYEILQLPDVEVTLHGDGLLQALARQKLSDPVQLQAWLDERENIEDTTIAVVDRTPPPEPPVPLEALVLD